MDQEHFDTLAKRVFATSSRRRVFGGAMASAFGAGIAAVTGVSAKGGHKTSAGHKKGKRKHGKGKGKTGAEFTCTANNANFDRCFFVGCAVDQDCFAVGCFGGEGSCTEGSCSGGTLTFNDVTFGACPPQSCCNSTAAGVVNPSCVDVTTQEVGGEGGLCGNANGEGVCRRCPPGTKCGVDVNSGGLRCICNVVTCPNGCCISNSSESDGGGDGDGDGEGGGNRQVRAAGDPDDQCIQNGTGQRISSPNPAFDGEFVCGTGGAFCDDCGSFFSGCCTEAGQCVNGQAALECGSNGVICQNCRDLGPDATCASQTCVGGTTTTTSTTGTTGTTGTTSTSTTTACAGKLCSSGTCCPNNKKCKSGGGCKKKHKKHHHH